MSLKFKLILLTLIPILLITATISWVSIYQARQLGEKEVKTFEQNLIKNREIALKDSVDLAFGAIEHIYHHASPNDEQAKEQVKVLLSKLRYGSDGYFFAYDEEGINLVHPVKPDLIGQNLINLTDENGNFIIQSLISQAQTGGGFHRYLWHKPSTQEIVPKLSYAAWLPKWNWMIGTGLYIEDISEQVEEIRTTVENNIETTFISVIALLSVTVAVIIALTLAINLHEHKLADKNLKELAYKTVMFQEDEKKHLARELHDGINQLLVSSKCHLELLSHHIDCNLNHRAQEHLHKSEHSLLTAINEVRRISHNLRPSSLDDIGLEAALHSLLADFSDHSKLTVNTYIETKVLDLHPDVVTTLYRIVQESLTNIEKHANASLVEVTVEQLGDLLQLVIRDDGVGFKVQSALESMGIGLRNMRERVEFIGGQFEITAEPNYGTEIMVLLDLAPHTSHQ